MICTRRLSTPTLSLFTSSFVINFITMTAAIRSLVIKRTRIVGYLFGVPSPPHVVLRKLTDTNGAGCFVQEFCSLTTLLFMNL